MADRPIPFSAPMVRALLAGTKTQTRRVVKPQPEALPPGGYRPGDALRGPAGKPLMCPHGQPGDRLWVKETIRLVPDQEPDDGTGRVLSIYAADGALTVADAWPWKRNQLNSIHCPRGLSRIELEVTGVRVERLQDISEADAIAEGLHFHDGRGIGHSGWREGHGVGFVYDTAREAYADLWQSINGPGTWAANPWVWVVEFKRVTP